MATALASQDPFSMPAKAWFKDPVEHAFKMRESHAGRHAADAEGLCEAAALRNAYAQWVAAGPEREQRNKVRVMPATHHTPRLPLAREMPALGPSCTSTASTCQ